MTTTGRNDWSILALMMFLAVIPSSAHAQWWTAAPADFEDCADRAEKSGAAKDIKAAKLAECDSKFAGRRKPGGGYTYYDFMQERSFDISGPNPSAHEQKQIDEHYTIYLDQRRRDIILAAFTAKQRQQQMALLEPGSREREPVETRTSPAHATSEAKAIVAVKPRPRRKSTNCAIDPLACGWSKLSSGINDVKKALFGSPSPKVKRT